MLLRDFKNKKPTHLHKALNVESHLLRMLISGFFESSENFPATKIYDSIDWNEKSYAAKHCPKDRNLEQSFSSFAFRKNAQEGEPHPVSNFRLRRASPVVDNCTAFIHTLSKKSATELQKGPPKSKV